MLQWKNIYPTNILFSQMKVRKNNKCSYCTDMVHIIQHFCDECPVVQDFWTFVEGTIQWECGINVKYAFYRHNVCKAKITCKRKHQENQEKSYVISWKKMANMVMNFTPVLFFTYQIDRAPTLWGMGSLRLRRELAVHNARASRRSHKTTTMTRYLFTWCVFAETCQVVSFKAMSLKGPWTLILTDFSFRSPLWYIPPTK